MLAIFDLPERSVQYTDKNVEERLRKFDERSCRITAFALAMITIFLFGISYILFGLYNLPPEALYGLSIIPGIIGAFVSYVATGVALMSVVCLAISAVQGCYKAKWAELIDQKKAQRMSVRYTFNNVENRRKS